MSKRANKMNRRVMRSSLKLAAPATGLKLDLGCGESPKDGFEGVDLHGTKAKHKVDLFKFPFPWDDNSVEEINASHFLEHIPAREIEERDIASGNYANNDPRLKFVGHDFLFAFMDECWRVLKHECWMHVVVPCARNNRAFQDPTHRRFFVEDTFAYFWKEWRTMNVPQYPVACNFVSEVNHTFLTELSVRAPEVQMQKIRHEWNGIFDLVVKLKAVKL